MLKNHDTTLVKRRLWKRDPHCFWCKKLTLEKGWPLGKVPDNASTIDHILNRIFAETNEQYRSAANCVLSCNKCNQDKSVREREAARLDTDNYIDSLRNLVKDRQILNNIRHINIPAKDKQKRLDLLEIKMAKKFPGSPGRMIIDIEKMFIKDQPIKNFRY